MELKIIEAEKQYSSIERIETIKLIIELLEKIGMNSAKVYLDQNNDLIIPLEEIKK